MEIIHIPQKKYDNSDDYYFLGMTVIDYALNIWQGFNVKLYEGNNKEPGHNFIAQPAKDQKELKSYVFIILDTNKPAHFRFSISTEYNPNGNNLITGSYTSIKNKDSNKVEITNFKYETDSGLKLDLSPISDNVQNYRFLMKIHACSNIE
ncbi:hypothetical protein [Arsenophonus nasoniae]|uniref:hypothetical protein n=1 Tax=Arsenophonus nasoniae TaxID=638 RepID=UPI00387A07FA